ncbi:deoxyribodipyrimidine photolyase [Niveispirillum lacus]|uniref:Deoxyribodipyrimidine photo-lyase n=1 Tax=Niveispirillum lacus TaxID=1981099 RepID=A0A255YW33_9PROT|nr:deoxyribodipyrimidine photo-lyase [Niveispirillum lacus]OYQ33446.1 deoxyribodipyrimidine photolyase [Niveispirillum lacus]
MTVSQPIIVWFRQDLRIADNPALHHAAQSGRPIIPVFVLDDVTPGIWKAGGATRWWLHHSLTQLSDSLRQRGLSLLLRRGPGDVVIADLAEQVGAAELVWNRCYEPYAVDRDTRLKAALKGRVMATSFKAALLNEPWEVLTGQGTPYKVFTPYWRAALAVTAPDRPLPAPDRLLPWPGDLTGDALADWQLLPTKPDWAAGLRRAWSDGEGVGERAAAVRLAQFLSNGAANYALGRDVPGIDGTSRLSPHLHFGEISPRQIWNAAKMAGESVNETFKVQIDSFLREIGWREFSHSLLYHFPTLPERPLSASFEAFPWTRDDTSLAAWQRGQTGYPIVDAGMRQLWVTGWMHNRVRMIVGSLLVKHLLLPWQAGERWFWDTLVDADLANNAAGWQWIGGCGADAAPYFRVFNPVLQGQKFDPDGRYVRQWVPELKHMPDKYIHTPWTAPPVVLRGAGVTLGRDYPAPIIDHALGRQRALDAFATIRSSDPV